MKAKPASHRGEVVFELNSGDESLLAAAGSQPSKPPFRLKRILVPTDFSDCARKALQYAVPLAKEHGAAITLLHFAPALSNLAAEYGGMENIALETELRASRSKDLADLAAEEIGSQVPSESLVYLGLAEDGIIAVAKKLAADLIVISTHGRTGLKHVLMGSVAEYVVRHAPCPVLVVRECERDFVAPSHEAASK